MNKLIIGSTAAHYWGLDRREPKDYDFFYTDDYTGDICGDSHCIPKDLMEKIPSYDGVITPDALLTLKASHLQWDIHWDKTKADILYLMSIGNTKIIEDLYQDLVSYWKTVHGDKGFLSLNKSKEEFFQDKVHYVYEHDELHEMVAYPDKPVYTRCLKDGQDVSISKEKFDELEFTDQVKMFKEEITVIALERWLLNKYNDVTSIVDAYQRSLKKTITNLTKGWASDFIIFNLPSFLQPDFSMFEKVLVEDNKMLDELKNKIKEVAAQLIVEKAENPEKFRWGVPSINEIVADLAQDYKEYISPEEFFEDYQFIDNEGGGEGGTEYCFGVFKWKGHYFKAEWSYYSYDGYNIDGIFNTLKEVTPKEKTITVYE